MIRVVAARKRYLELSYMLQLALIPGWEGDSGVGRCINTFLR